MVATRKAGLQVFLSLFAAFVCLSARSADAAEAPVLPDVLSDARVAPGTAHWTIQDIVEVRRIKETAIQGASRLAAFILEQPSIADGKNHYGLYQIDAARGGPARKIADSDYMADLAWRPGTADWTVLANFGEGVQLYTIKPSGLRQPLLVNTDTALVGGNDGMLGDCCEGPRRTGVVSYGWSQDGVRLWYSRLSHKSTDSQTAILDSGFVYDERRTRGISAQSVAKTTTIADFELRVLDTADGSDRLVATSSEVSTGGVFGSGGVGWADAYDLQYRQHSVETGVSVWSLWRFDLKSGGVSQVPTASADDAYSSTPTQAGYLTVQPGVSIGTLVEVGLDGLPIKRYGEVNAMRLAGDAFWASPTRDRFIYGTHLPDRDGLSAFPAGPLSKVLAAIPDYLSACSFNADLSFGLCSEESLSKAPTLVSISTMTGGVTVISRPNARYDAIAPLKTVSKGWTNRYGVRNTGYITYPRDYVPGRSYPALLLSHGWDAQNRFASDIFQWEFQIQVMAEQGYFILSINEPRWDPSIPAPYFPGGVEAGVDNQQLNQYLSPAASMEAATESLLNSGDINPAAVGIAGYSHGAETTYFVISHSQLFSAASLGDDPGMVPSAFFVSRQNRTWMKALYGGSPFDAAAIENYRKYSTSFRLGQVKTPLLQQFATNDGAVQGLEVDALFKDARLPTELVDYISESHIFYAPRHRASAMVRNLDWFNYWLLGKRDPDPAETEQYARWDAMAAVWRTKQAAATKSPDTSPTP